MSRKSSWRLGGVGQVRWGLTAYRQVGRSLACADEWGVIRCAGLAGAPPTPDGQARARCFKAVRRVRPGGTGLSMSW